MKIFYCLQFFAVMCSAVLAEKPVPTRPMYPWERGQEQIRVGKEIADSGIFEALYLLVSYAVYYLGYAGYYSVPPLLWLIASFSSATFVGRTDKLYQRIISIIFSFIVQGSMAYFFVWRASVFGEEYTVVLYFLSAICISCSFFSLWFGFQPLGKISSNKKMPEKLNQQVFLRRGEKIKGPVPVIFAQSLFTKGEIIETDELSNFNDGPWYEIKKTTFSDSEGNSITFGMG